MKYNYTENILGTNLVREDIPSPSLQHRILKMIINDVWGYNIKVNSFVIKDNQYSVDLELELFDHFGLNNEGIDPLIGKGYFFNSMKFSNEPGFLAWFVLQHSKKFNKKPSYIIVKFNEKITGSIF